MQLVQSGVFQIFDHLEDDGFMWRGDGSRTVSEFVEFPKVFELPPQVHVSPSMMDSDTNSFLRFEIRTDEVLETGFTVIFNTWSDSRFGRVSINWLAIGEADPDASESQIDFSNTIGYWEGV